VPRIETIRWVLCHSDYAGEDAKAVGEPDPKIIGTGPKYFDTE
jgi:polyphosphate kinase